MDLTEAEEEVARIHKKKNLYKSSLYGPDIHNGMVSHLEPEILECEEKRAIGSITTNKANGGDTF